MPPPSATERNRMKAFVENTGSHLPDSPRKHQRGDQSPDTAFTGNLESFNSIPATSRYAKAQDEVFDETRPPSVQSVDRRAGRFERIFTGSELSEGFMRSGLSTPTSETNIKVPVKYVSKPPYKQEAKTKKPVRLPHGGSHSLPTVTVGSDFRMIVTESQPNRIADMRDGFSTAGITNANARYPSSPVRNNHRHHHHHHNSHHTTQPKLPQKREPLMLAPRADEETRGRTQSRARFDAASPVFTDSDDGPKPKHDDEDVKSTPRGKQMPMRNRVHYEAFPDRQFVDRKRRHKSLDYDDQALNNMEYKELMEQPFDFDPATATALGNPTGNSGDGNQRLAQMRHMGSAEQQKFFAEMSVEEWESAGNWFSEQFTDIMRRLTAARQTKRHVMDSFELEAAAREAEVRRRSDKIDEKLQKMREDGMKVVGGHG
ncbi:hypothetical protein V2A60_007416 [Cordyceps javanica]|uniref:Extracellular mutant protein 11 domain-containing protein n=1 Tax=Cordyceps javanica TaxID=43265 RepID=A0A545W7W8_9HYPO|nr:extracellular mutant protein 11 domain-containing protein [Cordyceps javanica]TQW10093.1 extracellular mutant protein 11 domain-containing protein [Cordyceps javanica]